MNVSKSKLRALIKELPNEVEIEEVMYRLYILRKIESGEAALNEGRSLTHMAAIKRLTGKCRK